MKPKEEKLICVRKDMHHDSGYEYTLSYSHDMPGWRFVRETGKYASTANFKPHDNPIAMAAVENRKLRERNFDN
jgi:hypothetical protein